MAKLPSILTCTGCMVCVDACPKQAVSSIYNDEGHLSYKINRSLCIECGLCEKVCPVSSEYEYGNNNLNASQPFAAWAKDDRLRSGSTSGGVFAALAYNILSQNGVVVGAYLNHNEVKHVLIEDIKDIVKLQGSKYTQSNPEGTYKRVKQYLQEGRIVLYSGLGCQISGLLSYLGGKTFSDNLFTVDLVCGGVPSRFLIDSYLKENPAVSEIVSFRNKSKYELKVIDKEGSVYSVPKSQRPLPLCGFYTELTNRYACYDCHFTGAHRKSDLTIGDLWGDKKYPYEHQRGTSLVIAHTPKGHTLLNESPIHCYQAEWKDVLPFNPRIVYGKTPNSNSKARRSIREAFRNSCYDKLLVEYAGGTSIKHPLSYIKKFCHVVQFKLYRRKALLLVNKLLMNMSK